MRIKKWDWFVFALPVVIATAALLIIYCTGGPSTNAIIQIDGKTIQTIDLQTASNGILKLDTAYHNQIEIRDHQIGVTAADCPDKSCVRTGFIRYPGQSIICVPARLVITITGEPAADAVTGLSYIINFDDIQQKTVNIRCR